MVDSLQQNFLELVKKRLNWIMTVFVKILNGNATKNGFNLSSIDQ